MMAQYLRIKSELPADALLAFRLGDFYELFFKDAEVGAKAMGVALTRRGDVPMAGFPVHAAKSYVAALLSAGHRVAMVDVVGEINPGNPAVRKVTKIIEPGTEFDLR